MACTVYTKPQTLAYSGLNFFSQLTAEQSFACVNDMLRVNIRENLQIATKYADILGPVKLIEMFESSKVSSNTLSLRARTVVNAPLKGCVITLARRST